MFMKKILIKNSQIVVHTTSQKNLTDSFKYQYYNLIIVLSYFSGKNHKSQPFQNVTSALKTDQD